jgi:hypothetical protein
VAIGYSISQINKSFCSTRYSKSKNSHSSSPPLTLSSVPYILATTYHISNIFAKKNIKTLFKGYKILKQLFRTTKDESDSMLGLGIYKIPCSYDKSFIDQTDRSFKSCLK